MAGEDEFDIVVIGGGPGGYATALYGAAARQALRPVAAYRRADGWSLVLQSPEGPGAAWIVHFADSPGGLRARIVGVTLVDYAAKGAHA